MADTTAFLYERLPPELREEIVVRASDARTLGAMRAASTLLRDDVDRVHPLFSSIQGHDIVSGLASACEQMAAPRTIEAIIRSLAPSAIVRDPQDEAVIVRTEWTLPVLFFDYFAETTPSGAIRCISVLELQMDSHPHSQFANNAAVHAWISLAATECLRKRDLELALRIGKLVVRTGHIQDIVAVCASMFLPAAQIEGGAERLIKFIMSDIEDGDNLIATVLESDRLQDLERGHFEDWMLLLPILEAALPIIEGTARPRDIITWCFCVLCEYNLHWVTRLRVRAAEEFVYASEDSVAFVLCEMRAMRNALAVDAKISCKFGDTLLRKIPAHDAFVALANDLHHIQIVPVHEMQIPPFDPVPQTEHKGEGLHAGARFIDLLYKRRLSAIIPL